MERSGAPVLIGLGANLGDRASALCAAVEAVEPFVHWLALSRLYETAPMYVEDQPRFLNAVAVGRTELGPLALLSRLQTVEASLGRVPRERFGPREIDLDLLAYGSLRLAADRLELPHLRLAERAFVLRPLAELPRELLPKSLDVGGLPCPAGSMSLHLDPRWPGGRGY